MIRIAISAEAFAVIASILPPGTKSRAAGDAPNGQTMCGCLDRLARMRRPLESYSDVILRMVSEG
jgi:hypothetical protein